MSGSSGFLFRRVAISILVIVTTSAWSQAAPSLDQLLLRLGTPQAERAKEQIEKIGPKAIPRLKQLALRGPTAVRRDAINVLGWIGTYHDYDFLKKLVTDREDSIRQPASSAIDFVSKTNDALCLPRLNSLLSTSDRDVAKSALTAIEEIHRVQK